MVADDECRGAAQAPRISPTDARRGDIQAKYSDVANRPGQPGYFHTGRDLALKLGYDPRSLDRVPHAAVEAFCGVADPFHLREVQSGERVLDVGCGSGLDCFIAALKVGRGSVLGIDMTDAMIVRAMAAARDRSRACPSFRVGVAESLPVGTGSIDVVISNGVFNLCSDMPAVIREVRRCIRPGGYLQFADVSFPASSRRAAETHGFLSVERWIQFLLAEGFVDVEIGPASDTFEGIPGPPGSFDVFGYPFLARRDHRQ